MALPAIAPLIQPLVLRLRGDQGGRGGGLEGGLPGSRPDQIHLCRPPHARCRNLIRPVLVSTVILGPPS